MKIECLTLGAFATNCYIVIDEESGKCAVIDPADDFATIRDRLERESLSCEAILLTHAHCDHIAALRELAACTGATVYVGDADKAALAAPSENLSTALFGTSIVYDGDAVSVFDGSRIKVGKLDFIVMETAGHTKGSVCYLVEDHVFCGDTVFCGSIGRTDFPGGSYSEILQSLSYVLSLDEEYILCAGHGSSTTVAAEKRSNPYYTDLADTL